MFTITIEVCDKHQLTPTQLVDHYKTVRLHNAIGYITPQDKLAGRVKQIWNDRKTNLSIRRIGICWEATRSPRWTRKPQAWVLNEVKK